MSADRPEQLLPVQPNVIATAMTKICHQTRRARLGHLKDRQSKNKMKADRERYRRGKESLFGKGNKLYQDGCKVGRKRYVYICLLEKKDDDAPGRFSTYTSHATDFWPPTKEEVVSSAWSPSKMATD